MKNIHVGPVWSLLTMAIVFAVPVSAHHSAVGYDLKKSESAQATLKESRWTAPHSALVFTIKTAKGELQDIPMGGAAPGKFAKQGFKPMDFKVGDKMEVTWHPARNGRAGGIITAIKLPDGRVFRDAEFENLDAINANHFVGEEK